ncbi:MAG: type II toxin-antitoxin system RelE/ParE family toxin [Pseudomonadota bacterium]
MGYEVRRSLAVRDDLERIIDHLFQAYVDLGDPPPEAFERAALRLGQIEDAIDALGAAPHQGTLWPEVMDGLRWVTKDRAILYFRADDAAQVVTVLAVFFGGQDHKTHVLQRLLET